MGKEGFLHLFKHFENRSGNNRDIDIEDVITGCLQEIQKEIPEVTHRDTIIPAIVASALSSVGAWHEGMTRDQILENGYDSILSRRETRLGTAWRKVFVSRKECFYEFRESRLVPESVYAKKMEFVKDLQLYSPRDGPEEVWSAKFDPRSKRRLILSYVHDISQKGKELWIGERRSVRLTEKEAKEVGTPAFFGSEYAKGLNQVWHDGMRYPTPGGNRDSYGGVVPYMQPGAAVWHLVPRIRDGPGYPSTGDATHDQIIACFAELRCGKRELKGLEQVTVVPTTDKPFRDLSGIRRVWPMGEAVCGMLRDDVLISIQDMAGIALTLMHYKSIVRELIDVLNSFEELSKINKKNKIPCIPRKNVIKWADLCKNGEGASMILNQTLADAGCDLGDIESFFYATFQFKAKVEHLKFWYALLTARGQITNLQWLRLFVLEDLAIAPVYDSTDRPKVYFMIEAAAINRLERHIPFEESLRRFLRSGMRGELLLEAIDNRSVEISMEITLPQIESLLVQIWYAAKRQPVWNQLLSQKQKLLRVFMASWLSGTPGVCYVGRHTTSMSKPLYFEAAKEWAQKSVEDIVRIATVGKKRMVVLLTESHRIYRKIDEDSKTKIIVCSILYMNEEQHNLALAAFGDDHFRAEERHFRGHSKRRDAMGNPVDYEGSRIALCAVDQKKNYFELENPSDIYQIVVTEKFGAKHAHLAAIRRTLREGKREPVAISWMDVLEHMRGENGDQLLEMRPDQMSPDGCNLVDYSFEYDAFWADYDGNIRTTNTEEKSRRGVEVAELISSLREKEWWGSVSGQ